MQEVEELKGFNMLKTSIKPWVICFSASLFFFYQFIQGNMFASIADNIMHDFHIEADKMNYLSSGFYLSNVIFLFVAGMVLDRFSTKKTLLLAMLLSVVGTFTLAYSSSFSTALVSRFMTGTGSAFCFLGPIRLASLWFPPKRMALVTGSIVTMAMTGGMLAQYPMTRLVLQMGWRDSVVVVASLGLVLLCLMAIGIEDKPQENRNHKPHSRDLLSILKKAYASLQTWRAAFYCSLMNMGVAVFGAMMGSLYLMQRLSVSKAEASMVNSMLFLGCIVGAPLIGWCSDRLRLRILPMKIGVVTSLLTILAILYLPVSLPVMAILFFLLGFFTAAQCVSYPLVAESSPDHLIAAAVSIVSILTQGGYILYQYLFSQILLWHGEMHMVNGVPIYSLADYQTAALILPIGFCLAWVALLKLKETHCHPVEEHME